MAEEIVEKLKVKVSGEERLAKHYTESSEAYQLYLRAASTGTDERAKPSRNQASISIRRLKKTRVSLWPTLA